MKLSVLGSCGPYPSKTGCLSGYLIETGGKKIMLDMGSGSLHNLTKVCDLDSLDAIFISHLHFDHTSDLLPFQYYLDVRKNPVTLYIHESDSEYYKLLTGHPKFNIVNINNGDVRKFGPASLSFFELEHSAKNFAIKITTHDTVFVYTGDTVFTEKLYDICEDADYLLADCAKPDTFNGSHAKLSEMFNMCKELNIQLLVTHFSPNTNPKKDFSSFKEVEIVEEISVYEL
jgi:ribonuclease BN (tRNA processing enzyme)